MISSAQNWEVAGSSGDKFGFLDLALAFNVDVVYYGKRQTCRDSQTCRRWPKCSVLLLGDLVPSLHGRHAWFPLSKDGINTQPSLQPPPLVTILTHNLLSSNKLQAHPEGTCAVSIAFLCAFQNVAEPLLSSCPGI